MLKFTSLVGFTAGILVLLGTGVACQSKFSEPSPDTVSSSNMTLEERVQQKSLVDARITELQGGAEKAKSILEMLQRVQNPNASIDVYTPLDFLIDLNLELKSKIPTLENERMTRVGVLNLPIDTLSKDCRSIATKMVSIPINSKSVDKNAESKSIGERITYSIKICGANSTYMDVVTADWIGNDFQFNIINKNLEMAFGQLVKNDSKLNSICKIKQNKDNVLDYLACENFETRLSESEIAKVEKITFDNHSETRFEAHAQINENGTPKTKITVRVLSNGEKKVEVLKITDQQAMAAAPSQK